MPSSRVLAALAALAALGLPAAAQAQGAGDNQYQDPFGNSTPAAGGGQRASAPHPPPRRVAPVPATAPAPAAASVAPSASGSPAGSAAQSASSGVSSPSVPATNAPAAPTLPYTGFNALQEALAGGVLLAIGLALRTRTRIRSGD